jgi:tetratricopeptide (TPR) repeat protein
MGLYATIEFEMKATMAIMVLALLSGEAPSVNAASSWGDLSNRAAGEGDYARALDYLSRLEIASPGDPLLRSRQGELLAAYGISLYRQKKLIEAESALRDALAINPRNPDALKALGYVAYDSQNLAEAESLWRESLSRRPDPDLEEQLKRLVKEAIVENGLSPSRAANFELRFQPGAPEYNIYDIQDFLLEAQREVGKDYMYYPSRPIVVIMYTRPEFDSLRASPAWLGGMYDGKIRLPVPEGGLVPSDFKKILWHEYTHALLHDLAGNRCPRWLQEGLAQYEEAKIDPPALDRLEAAGRRGEIIPFSALSSSLEMGNRPETAALAYAEAYSLVDHIVETYGFFRIAQVLQRLSRGEEWGSAFRAEIGRGAEEVFSEWREGMEAVWAKGMAEPSGESQ